MIDVLSASQILIIDIIFSVFSLISLLSALIMTIDILIRIGKKIQESNRANMDTSREPLLKAKTEDPSKTSTARSSISLGSFDGNKFKKTQSAKSIWILTCWGELLILSLALSDFASACWYLVSLSMRYFNQEDCSEYLAFIGAIFEPSSVFWVCCITTAMYILLLKSQTFQTKASLVRSLRWQFLLYSIFSWLTPVALAIVGFKNDALGNSQTWCLFKSEENGIPFYLFNLPVLTAFFYNLFLLLVIYIHNKKKKLGFRKLHLLWYIPAFFLVWSFHTVSVLIVHQDPSFVIPFWLRVAMAVTLPSQGFLNALIWGFLLRKKGEGAAPHSEEEVFSFTKSIVCRTTLNLFGNQIEWFVEEEFDRSSKT